MNDLFYEFLYRVDKDFQTPLSSRVSLREYADKLLKNAFLSVSIQNNEIIGCIALYCNDIENKLAYIPLVAVDKRYRGQHISKALMSCAIRMAKEKGFKTIGIHTESTIALNLYYSLNFQLKEDNKRKYLELTL